MNLAEALLKHDMSQADVSRTLGLGTTTIWRALKGTRIDPESAKKLCTRFPELSFADLVTAPRAPTPKPVAKKLRRKAVKRVARAS